MSSTTTPTTPATPATPATATAAIIEPSSRIESVKLEGLALLRIAKHCHESLPQMVTGSLLGLVVDDNVLEITHAFAVPDEQQQDNNNINNNDGDFQVEMMGLLREVNVDHNCVGWYQSMYLGSYSTTSFLENQFSYQTDLSEHAVVVLYDPMQTTHGNLVLRCFRLSSSAMNVYKQSQSQQQQGPSGPSSPTSNNNNSSSSTTTTPPLQDPKSIFEELPVTLTQPGLVKAFLMDQKVNNTTTSRPTTLTTPTDFSRLDLSTNPYLEKHLEFLCSWVDDLVHEQHKFQSYARNRNRASRNNNNNNNATDQDATTTTTTTTTAREPSRMESLLLMNQIHSYCQQVDKFAGGGFGKLYLAGALHKKE